MTSIATLPSWRRSRRIEVISLGLELIRIAPDTETQWHRASGTWLALACAACDAGELELVERMMDDAERLITRQRGMSKTKNKPEQRQGLTGPSVDAENEAAASRDFNH